MLKLLKECNKFVQLTFITDLLAFIKKITSYSGNHLYNLHVKQTTNLNAKLSLTSFSCILWSGLHATPDFNLVTLFCSMYGVGEGLHQSLRTTRLTAPCESMAHEKGRYSSRLLFQFYIKSTS